MPFLYLTYLPIRYSVSRCAGSPLRIMSDQASAGAVVSTIQTMLGLLADDLVRHFTYGVIGIQPYLGRVAEQSNMRNASKKAWEWLQVATPLNRLNWYNRLLFRPKAVEINHV